MKYLISINIKDSLSICYNKCTLILADTAHPIKLIAMITFALTVLTLNACGPSKKNKTKDTHPSVNEETSQKSPTEQAKDALETTPEELKTILTSLKKSFESGPILKLNEIKNIDDKPLTIIPALMNSFCVHAYKLPLQTDFSSEMEVLCGKDKKPTEWFQLLDRYVKTAADPRALEISHSVDGDYSQSMVVSVVKVPLVTKFVKEAQVQAYMSAPFSFGYFEQDGAVSKNLSNEIGGDLGFARYEVTYSTKNYTPDGKNFSNNRVAIYNGYQVQGGNPDIGLSTEHNIGPEGDYRFFRTISLAIGTKDQETIIINVANLSVKHNGYPEEVRKLSIDTSTAIALHAREGITLEKTRRIDSKK